MNGKLSALVGLFQRYLYFPDPGPLLVSLGTIAAHRAAGDPVWVMLIGPPGSGRTEIIQTTAALDYVHLAGDLTVAGLLSGSPRRERSKDSKGGLLREIGDSGVLLCKDFTSVLSANREALKALLAALREIYDGQWTRRLGTDGGLALSWAGKVGFLGGCTQAIDRHHAVMATMGERFLFYRMPQQDGSKQSRYALRHAASGKEMRKELSHAVVEFFGGLECETKRGGLSDQATDRLVALAELAARCRSAVDRDSYTREILVISEPEAPTRIVIALDRLWVGLEAIGVDTETAWLLIRKVALDSMPAARRAIFDPLAADPTCDFEIAQLVKVTRYPSTTVRRQLEELAIFGVLTSEPSSKGKPGTWRLSEWAGSKLALIGGLPEVADALESRDDPNLSDQPHRPSIPEISDTTVRAVPEKSVDSSTTPLPEMSLAFFTKLIPELSGAAAQMPIPEMAEDSSSSKDKEDISGKGPFDVADEVVE